MHDKKLTVSIDIKADKESVWDALINPNKVKEYLFGTEVISKWKQGSAIIFQGEWNGTPYKDHGVIKEFIPMKKLQYTYISSFAGLPDLPENYSLITFELHSASQGGQILTLQQKGFTSDDAYQHSQSNWKSVLSAIKQLLEQNKSLFFSLSWCLL